MAKFVRKYLSGLLTLILSLSIVVPSTYLADIPLTKAATFTVTNTSDNGAGSLRQAIIDANLSAGTDTIAFSATGTITLSTTMDTITSNIVIDGTTAPDWQMGPDITIAGTTSLDCLVYGSLGAEVGAGSVKGINISTCRKGIQVQGGPSGITIGGTGLDIVNINGSTKGISLEGGNNVTIYGTQIGTSSPNTTGIQISDGTTLTIGGTTSGQENTIMSNTGAGIVVGSSTGVTIANNYIGVGIEGGAPFANATGIQVVGTSITSLTIGGTTSSSRNYISGNTGYGIQLDTGASNGATIKNNFIGVSSTGFAIPNGSGGMLVQTGSNTISSNVVSGNTSSGIKISGTGATSNTIDSNNIGVDGTGNTAVANITNGIMINTNASNNTISNNVISGNLNEGILIDGDSTGTTYIYGNKIGLGVDVNTSIPNTFNGINAASKVTIGDSTNDAYKNYIAGNTKNGILLIIHTASLSVIANNIIGSSSDGSARPNLLNGIMIDSDASGVTIGSETGSVQEINNNGQSGIKFDGSITDSNIVYKNHFKGNGLAPITIANSAHNSLALTTGNLTVNTSGASGTSNFTSGVITILSGTSSTGLWVGTGLIAADSSWSIGGSMGNGDNYWFYANDTTRTSASTATGTVAVDNTAPAEPVVTSSTGTVATASYTLTGTKDIYTSIFNASSSLLSFDSQTTWNSSTSLVEGVNTFTLDSRDYTNNVSSTGTFTVTLDTVTPYAPTLSYNSVYAGGSTAPITGTGEASSLIYVNDVYTTTAAGDGTFTLSVTVVNGTNSFRIKAIDAAGNTSPESLATIAPGGGGSSSSFNFTPNTTSTTTTTTDTSGQSMAGEAETSTPVPVTTSTVTPPSNTSPEVNLPPVKQTAPVSTPVVEETKQIKPTYTNLYAPETNTQPAEVKVPITEEANEVTETTEPTPVFVPKVEPVMSAPLLALDFMGEKGADLIPTWWKDENFGDGSLELSATTDTDNDGLPDAQEFLYGTDPKTNDTDKDGVSDTVEIDNGSNPDGYDTDGDGISDMDEKSGEVAMFNPKVIDKKIEVKYIEENNIVLNKDAGETLGTIDTDKDGISDQQELQMGSDPKNLDSDSDGLSDGNEVLVYDTNPAKASKVSAVNIGNIKKGQVNAAGKQYIMGGTDSPNVEVNLYAIDKDGNETKIGTTTTDENGLYSLSTSEIQEGKYTVTAVLNKDNKTLSVSYPQELNVSKTVSVTAPEITVKVDNNQVTIDGLLNSKDSSVVVTWRSLVLTSTIVADQNFKLIAPEGLSAGDHTATVYTVSNIDNSQSAPVEVQFTLATTGFASGQTQGISPLITIGGSSLILISLIALAIFRRRNNGGNGLNK